MSKKILIEVEIEDVPGNSIARYRGNSCWTVRLYNETDDVRYPSDPVTSLAHELGHVLANEFQLPHAMKDYRGVSQHIPGTEVLGMFTRSDYGLRICNAEAEAWDVAEMIFRTRANRRACLEAYEETYGVNRT